jgi:hypothetical protein
MNIPTKDMVLARLLSLLQSTLSGSPPPEILFDSMDAGAWNSLFRRAVKEGLMAVAFDGMMRLPENLHPPRMLELSWGAGTDHIERKYSRFEAVADELAARFAGQGVSMLVIKGLSLAQYHPIPSHREFGDLDIYLFGQKEKGDQLLRQWDAKEVKEHSWYKHSGFMYKGVSIENHAYFLNVRRSRQMANLNTRLIALADKESGNAPLGKPVLPDADFTALFFMIHALNHFAGALPVWRHFYDWAVFLHANKGKWDMNRYGEALSEAGLKKPADVYTAITVDYLGLPLEEAPPFERDSVLEEKILRAMGAPSPAMPDEKSSLWSIMDYKWRRLLDSRWRQELISPGSFYKVILNSIFNHIQITINCTSFLYFFSIFFVFFFVRFNTDFYSGI